MSMTVYASAPGRLCLAGESLDWMQGGSSVVAAVPLRTHVTVAVSRQEHALLLRSDAPISLNRCVGTRDIDTYPGDPLDFLQATARIAALKTGRWLGGVLDVRTDLPVGAGLSSSAAVTLASAAALLAAHTGQVPDVGTVCFTAREAETGEMSTGAGWMDFLACGEGQVRHITAIQPPSTRLLANSLGAPVVLIDTKERRSTSAILASKRNRLFSGDPDMRTYVLRAPEVVEQMRRVFGSHPVDHAAVGALLTEGQALLRDRVHCSTPLIDECVKRCLAAGAYGAKLSGSGHGGCLFALVPPDAVYSVLRALESLPVDAKVLTSTDVEGVTCTITT